MRKFITICSVILLFGTGYAYPFCKTSGFYYNMTTGQLGSLWGCIPGWMVHNPNAINIYANGISGGNIVGNYNGYDDELHQFYVGSFIFTIGQTEASYFSVPSAAIDGSKVAGGNEVYDFVNGTSAYHNFPGAILTFIKGNYGNIFCVGSYMEPNTAEQHGFGYYNYYGGDVWTTLDFPGANLTSVEDIYVDMTGNHLVGYYMDANLCSHGFLYEHETWYTLDFPGAKNTTVMGFDGSNIVGYYSCSSFGGRDHGFIYNGTTWTSFDFPGANIVGTVISDVDGDYLVGTYDLVPEPATIFLLGSGGLALLRKRKK